MTQEDIIVCRLGRVAYETAWNVQRDIQQLLVRDKRSDHPEVLPHVLMLLEHPPVFTLGKSGNRSHLLVDEVQLRENGATYVEIDRGGDITYHGPGQIVGYPILDLDRFYTDIHRYLRDLEEVVIRTCAEFGVVAGRLPERTGVWVRVGSPDEAKICALGIRCSRWVTMHGFALNVNTDLDHFSMIVPCGIADRDVTSLARETGGHVPESKVEAALIHHFMAVFGARALEWASQDAESFLRAYLAIHHLTDSQS